MSSAARILVVCAPLLASGAASAEAPDGPLEALRNGKPLLSLRYRFENVSDDAFQKEGRASTLRTALGYESGAYRGWSLFVEAENVADLGAEDLHRNAGAGSRDNGVRDRPTVADPALTELNQAWAQWKGKETSLRIGRQEITHGDHRFVGNVGWRQNHQSYDALTLVNESLDRVAFNYSYVARVHRIFGDGRDLSGHLFNAAVKLGAAGKLTLYGYLLDYDERAFAGLSSSTLGAEWTGRRSLGGGTDLLYELEVARQRDSGENPFDIEAGYRHALVGVSFGRLDVKLGWEVLEGSAREGQFQTPLATLHKFNGWADKFLATPQAGLEDLYLQLEGEAGRFEWLARLHDFSAASGGASYGAELDLQLLYRAPWKQVFALTGALYDADEFSTDSERWWLWTSYGF